jgi:D-glycero-D-manno-heptose 1,7-bisphosphate phosphatase
VKTSPAALGRAVFLDRDGVINRSVVCNGKPFPPRTVAEFSIYPDVVHACSLLKSAGFLLIVATNQPDVGRGSQDRAVVEEMHRRMLAALPIDRIEVCYDPVAELSECYKPAPGMLLRAARELSLDLSQSYMIGDRWRDVDCGYAAGCTTVFIDRGYSEELRRQPDFRAGSLLEAAGIVLRDCTGSSR